MDNFGELSNEKESKLDIKHRHTIGIKASNKKGYNNKLPKMCFKNGFIPQIS